MAEVDVSIRDGTFAHEKALGHAGENSGKGPAHFQWVQDEGPARVRFFTDMCLEEAKDDPAERKVAMLVESPSVNPGAYERAWELRDHFSAILSCEAKLTRRGGLFYPIGGSWIEEWDVFPKTKAVSILVSEKAGTEGQRMRHVCATFDGVDAYGAGVNNWVESKAEALRDYRYAIVIENGRHEWYFTEKLVDCLSQGTIPIYWGCPGVFQFFGHPVNPGIVQCDGLRDVENVVRWATTRAGEQYYERYQVEIAENLERAREYACAEDWIWEHYPELFND